MENIKITFYHNEELVEAFVCDLYPGYSITEYGVVFSHTRGVQISKKVRSNKIDYKTGKKRKICKNPKGYPIVGISLSGQKKTVSIHGWVAYVFYGKKPDGLEVRHLDGNKCNSHFSNLKYGTNIENASDRSLHGLYPNGEKHINSKLTNNQATEIRKIRLDGVSIKAIAGMYNIGVSTVESILQNKSYKCGVKTLLRVSENYTKRFK